VTSSSISLERRYPNSLVASALENDRRGSADTILVLGFGVTHAVEIANSRSGAGH
jgi:hypothetical protein